MSKTSLQLCYFIRSASTFTFTAQACVNIIDFKSQCNYKHHSIITACVCERENEVFVVKKRELQV